MRQNGYYTYDELCQKYPRLADQWSESRLSRWHLDKMIDAVHDPGSDRLRFSEADVLLCIDLDKEINH